jgi:hypothetical protein
MSTLKECQVVIIPTKEKSKLYIDSHNKPCRSFIYYEQGVLAGCTNQHLYIVSDDQIKEGDWYLVNNIRVQEVRKATEHSKGIKSKIIATTDKSLTVTEFTLMGIGKNWKQKPLPEPSKEFIQKYCKAGGIDKVMVEYDSKIKCYKCGKTEANCIATSSNCVGYYEETYQLKVSKDNTITIKPVKDSWNREEVEELCRRAWILGLNKPPYQEIYNAWKESNL